MNPADVRTDIQCFIIHLERARQRAQHVKNLSISELYKAEVVSAVDGRGEDFDASSFYNRSINKPTYPFTLRTAEVATFLSHRKCWQRIVSEEIDVALILEDDVSLAEPEFKNALSLALENLQQGDIVRFPVKPREYSLDHIAINQSLKLFRPSKIGLGTQAQVVTRGAAEKLLAKTQQFDRPIDTYLQLFWEHGVRILSVWPSGVSEESANLGGSLIGDKQSLWTKITHEVQRPIYRLKVHGLIRKNRS
jgi:GR25 family glycosyltransferase involved in LPS biosynthesis